jgi:predicted dehydrogenase
MFHRTKVGVIGAGYLGRFHAIIYSKMEQVELVGINDINLERAQIVATEAKCSVFENFKDLLNKVDAVSIVVPTTSHAEIAQIFLANGIHTLLEKPIASTRNEAQQIVDAAKIGNALLQIGHLERFNPGVIALAQHINQPRFIEAQRMGAFSGRAADVDVIADLMIHDLDIILSLVSAPIKSVAAIGTSVLTEHIDIANARLEFSNGAVANLVASRVSEHKLRRIRVFQPQSYISLDMEKQILELASPRPQVHQQWPGIHREQIKIASTKPLDAELAAFIHSVRTHEPPLIDGYVGLRALDVALRVKEKIMV